MRLIISIDGGGIRGIIPLVVLRAIQQRLSKDLKEYNPQWFGTSTGAIIAAGIQVQDHTDTASAIQNILDIYEFRSTSSVNPLGAKHPERALHKILDENFDFLTLAEVKNLSVVVCREDNHAAVVLHNNPDINLSTSLKATCAVPGVFGAVSIQGTSYVDGFLKAKNPAGLAMESQGANTDYILLSLGTGILRQTDAIELQVRDTHLSCEERCAKRGIKYFRFNPRLCEAADDMQDTRLKNIFALKKDSENYLFDKRDLLDDLIQTLESF